MKKLTLLVSFLSVCGLLHAQSWLTTGNSGLTNTNFLGTTDARDLNFKTNNTQYGKLTSGGQWRLGSTTSYVKVDSIGRLSFVGSGVYQVNSNAYAFQWSGNANIGLFFSASNSRYEFRNSTAGQAFYCTSGGVGYFSSKLSLGTTTAPTGALLANGVIESSSGGFKFPDATTQTTAFTPYAAGTGITISSNTITNSKPDQTVTLTGSGATNVSGTYPNFTISSTDNNTTYSGGTGINVTGTTITNTSPDQTVTLTGSGATNVSGTYPNFTISSTDNNTTYSGGTGINVTGTAITNTSPDQIVTLTGSGATNVSGTYPNFTISSTDNNTSYTAGTGISITGNTIANSAPTQWTTSGSSIYYNTGKTGIGTSSPSEALHLSGGNLLVTGTFGTSPAITVTGSGTRMFFDPNKAAFRAGNVGGSNWDNANIGNYSVALGKDVTASGANSVAMGLGATASGANAVAIGNSLSAGGSNAFAAGYAGFATGNNSIAAGYGNDAEGENSVAFGNSNTSFADNAVAIGTSNNNLNTSSFTIGSANLASADNSFAIGNSNQTDGNNSVTLGNGLVAQSFEEVVVGVNNMTYAPSSTSSWNAGDRLFVVGNGTSAGSQSNALTILKNGNTGIGTSLPSQKLEVSGTTKTTNLQVTNGATANYVLRGDASGNAAWTNPDSLFLKTQNTSDNTPAALNFGNSLNRTIVVSNVAGTFTNDTKLYITLNITCASMSNVFLTLDAPNGETVTLAGGGTSGANFTNTVFSSETSSLLSSGTAPYTGSFLPVSGSFSGFVGSLCNGSWTLHLNNFSGSMTFQNWSLSITNDSKGDNLGNHIATANIQLNDFYLSNGEGNNGIRISDNGLVGINTAEPINALDITGGLAVGSSYAGNFSAASNGAIIQGKVGIGTSSPALPLDVHGTVSGTDCVAAFYNTTNDNSNTDDGVIIKAGHTSYNASKQSSLVFFQRPDGTVMGSVTQAGSTSVAYNTTSDSRLKENIRDTKLGLKDLMKIQVSDYNYKGDLNRHQTGYIAQQLYEVFPDAVHVGGDDEKTDPWMVDYGRITPLIVKSVQQLSLKVDSMEAAPLSSFAHADAIASLQQQLAEKDQQIIELNHKLDAVLNKISAMESSLSQCCTAFQSSNQSAISNPESPILEQNVPNPFLQTSYIKFYIPSSAKEAMIVVSDVNGSVKKQFTRLAHGFGTVNIEAGMLDAGTYQYSLLIDGKVMDTKKMILTK